MKKVFEKVKIWIDGFIQDWYEETPKIWKWIRNIAGSITTALVVLSGVGNQFPTLEVPYWFSQYGWYIAAACAIITGYSGKQKKVK